MGLRGLFWGELYIYICVCVCVCVCACIHACAREKSGRNIFFSGIRYIDRVKRQNALKGDTFPSMSDLYCSVLVEIMNNP